jgi:hypothetical protein
VNTNDNYQASYTTVAYTNPIPLPIGLARTWLNYANHTTNNTMQFPTFVPLDRDGYSYETLLQFPFRSQPVEMMPTRAMAESYVNPNILTTQLATILRVFWYRPQPVEMTPARGTVESYANPSILTAQLATILRVFWYRTQG